MCRNRSYDCQWLVERASNPRVRHILLDMSRTWTRLALEAEECRRDNFRKSRLAKKDATHKLEPSMFSGNGLSGDGSKRLASGRWSEIHPDRLTGNRIEAQSE
jgi:hypothetical protein